MRISAKQTGELLAENEFVSVFGHRSSIRHLSRYLRIEIPHNRGTITLGPDDMLIVASIDSKRVWELGFRGCPKWRFFLITLRKEERDAS